MTTAWAAIWSFVSCIPMWFNIQNSVVIFIITLILFIVHAIRRKIKGQLGDNEIRKDEISKRTCGDCVLLMMALREKFDHEIDLVLGSILKNQMNYAEQKLLELQNLLYTSYTRAFSQMKSPSITSEEEIKQTTIYYGLLRDTTWVLIKDEIRRSFKENNFQELGGMEFSVYVKNKFHVLSLMANNNYDNRYPRSGMVIDTDMRKKLFEQLAPQIEDMLFEVFINAKEVKNVAYKKADELNKKFKEEIDQFVIR